MEVLYGLHPVEEAIRSGSRQLDHVSVARERRDDRLERLIELCRTTGIRGALEPRDQLTRLARTDAHQGVLALDERGTPDYTECDFRTDCVLVLGREGAGLHDLVKKTCDHLLRIPMAGQVSSLNVSVAGAIVMYEAMRQRRQAAAPPAARKPAKERKGLGS